MNKITTIIAATTFVFGILSTSTFANQAAPQSSDKAKEMMNKVAVKKAHKGPSGKSAAAHMNAEHKKMEGHSKADAAKNKPKKAKKQKPNKM